MDEMTVKNRIVEAMNEPKVPERLVDSILLRVEAITKGRKAEQRLEEYRKDLSADEVRTLAAEGVIGRLASVAPLPEGIQVDALTQKLAKEPGFIRAVETGDPLKRLRSGELVQETVHGRAESERIKPKRAEAKKEGPAL